MTTFKFELNNGRIGSWRLELDDQSVVAFVAPKLKWWQIRQRVRMWRSLWKPMTIYGEVELI